MDATVAATITGVLLSVSFAAYAMSFARLRSDMHAGFDRLDTHFDRLDTHSTGWTPIRPDGHPFDRLDTHSTGWTPIRPAGHPFDRLDTHFDRLDTRFDELTTALGCSAALTESDDSEGDH